jgi:DNA-binding MarR family transcriptional regulator
MQRNEHWQRRRIAWSELDDVKRLKRFDQALQAHRNGVSASPGSFEDFTTRQEWLDTFQRTRTLTNAAALQPMPALFGSSERTLIVSMFAVNGPMTVRELARARNVDSSTTFRTVERLIRCGLLVKRQRVGGRKYVSFNRAHIAAAELRSLLDVLAKHYGTPHADQPRYRHGLPLDRDTSPPLAEKLMFGSSLRSRMLVLLAATGEADETQVRRLLAVNALSLEYASKALIATGVLCGRKVGSRFVLSLAEGYVGASEFKTLLLRLVEEAPSYQTLRDLLPIVTLRWR